MTGITHGWGLSGNLRPFVKSTNGTVFVSCQSTNSSFFFGFETKKKGNPHVVYDSKSC